MAFANSIYNVAAWESGVAYVKNDIVSKIEFVGDSATNKVPKEIKYYYATRDSTGQDPEDSNENPKTDSIYWKGYSQIGKEYKPNFFWLPSYNISTKHDPSVNLTKFGNGYEQRTPDGLFSSLIKMEVTFDKRSEREARVIAHFLKARKAVESFVFETLPNLYADDILTGGWRKRFVCSTFNTSFVYFDNYTVTASFSQENN
jgi:phage-related protein